MSTLAIVVAAIIMTGVIIKFVSVLSIGFNYSAIKQLEKAHEPTTSKNYRQTTRRMIFSFIGAVSGALLSNGVFYYIENTAAYQDVYREISQLFVDFIHMFVN